MDLSVALDDYLLDCRRLSPKTASWYDQKLRVFIRYLQREGITQIEATEARHLRAFQEWMITKRVCDLSPAFPWNQNIISPLTIRGYIQAVKTWGEWLVREDYLPKNPFEKVKKPKEPVIVKEVFTEEDVARLLATTKAQSPQNLRDRALVLFLLDTGLRASEVIGLRLSHLHLREDIPWVSVDWHTSKGKKAREVGLGGETVKAITRYLRLARFSHNTQDDHVWMNRYGQPLTTWGLNQAIEELQKRAGLMGKQVSPHIFRHTFTASFLKSGGDIFTLSRLLGHSSVAVTERYARTFQSRDARALQAHFPSVADSFLRPS